MKRKSRQNRQPNQRPIPHRRSRPSYRPPPKYMFEPLTGFEFKKRMEESFSPVYLTGISIIQGVALGLLCQQLFTIDSQGNFLSAQKNPATLLYSWMSLMCIVGISYEYNWFVGIHRWSQKFIDTLLPFILGFWEIGAILNISYPKNWWFIMGLFALSGMIAFINTYVNCKTFMFKDEEMFNFFRKNISTSATLILSIASLSLFITYIYDDMEKIYPWYIRDTIFCLIYTSLTTWLLFKDKHFVQKVHSMFNLEG